MVRSFRKDKKDKALPKQIKSSTLKKNNLTLWFIPIFLVFLSGCLIASTQRTSDLAQWYQHWITAAVGIIFSNMLARLPLRRYKSFLVPIYLSTVLSLIAVRFIGVSALGSQRWLNLGGLNIQPSEVAKLVVILLLAAVLEDHPVERPRDLIRPLIVISIPWALVFLQPDLGTSLVFGAILITMLYWAGMKIEWVVILFSGLITSILSATYAMGLVFWIPLIAFLVYRSVPFRKWSVVSIIFFQISIYFTTPWIWQYGLKPYQRDRLLLFMDPSKDPLGGGYHLLQSTVGIGSGGLFGTGLLQGELTKLRFIPEQHTDFIFSALGEETGFLGTLIVVLGFFLLIFQLLKVARRARTDYESLVVIGIGAMIMFQVVVNIFMTVGLGPVTGIPLPFMSYGRTALMVNFAAIGLCLSVARQSSLTSENL